MVREFWFQPRSLIMDIAELDDRHKSEERRHKVFVTVISPSGIYPDDEPLKINSEKLVSEILDKAAKKLNLTDTSDWVVYEGERQIDAQKSFADNHLHGTVELQWHKPEGGGGASNSR
jgi:hypothetical protein